MGAKETVVAGVAETELGEFTEGGEVSQETIEDVNAEAAEAVKTEVVDSEIDIDGIEWDTERQRADQAEANLRKIQSERDALSLKIEQANSAVRTLQERLDAYAKEQSVNIDEIDTESVDPAVLKILKSMKSQVELANRKAEQLEAKSKESELNALKQAELKAETEFREKSKSEILKDIEADFGSKFRNEAIKMANDICAKRGSSPRDRYEAARLLRQCYKKLSGAKPAQKAPAVDTGKTTVTTQKIEDIKPGTLREVIAQMRAKAGLT